MEGFTFECDFERLGALACGGHVVVCGFTYYYHPVAEGDSPQGHWRPIVLSVFAGANTRTGRGV